MYKYKLIGAFILSVLFVRIRCQSGEDEERFPALTDTELSKLAGSPVKSDVEDLQLELIEDRATQIKQEIKRTLQKGHCPSGFTFLPSTESCYKVVYEKHDWYSAGKRCQQFCRGSELVAITSAEENSEVKTFLANEVSSNPHNTACIVRGRTEWGNVYWTSGQQLVKGVCRSPFVWKRSSDNLLAFDFTSWAGGEPNCGIGEFCVGIWIYHNFRWDDSSCSETTCPLCEYTPQ